MGHSRPVWICLVLLSLVSGGCQEMFTYSKKSRAQGVKYMENGQYLEAQGAFRDAVRQNPRDYRSYSYLGQLYARDKQYANAISNFKTSLDVQASTPIGRGDEEFKLQTIEALAKTLAESDVRDVEVNKLKEKAQLSTTGDEYYALALVFAERGDADSAIEAYRNASSQAPDKFYIAKSYALYLERLGQKQMAEEALRRAYRMNPEDEEVNTALRRLGIIPGPALLEEGELAQPMLPRGPLPDLLNRGERPSATPPAGENPAAPAD